MALRSRSRRRSSPALSAPPVRGVERLWGRLVDLFGRREPLSATALVLAPRRLEPRRLLDAGAASLALELLDDGDFVQAGPDFASLADSSEQPQAVVPNTPPSNLVLQPITAVDEGGAALLTLSFDDPDVGDVHTVEISWGDGSGLLTLTVAAGAKTFSTTHTYADDPLGTIDPPFTVSVRVLDAEGANVTGTTTATVRNVTPVVTAVDPVVAIDENQIATLELEFSDPGVKDTHQVIVHWGDGTPTQVFNLAAGARSFTATHQYLDDNATDQFTITFHVRDDDLGISGPDTTVAAVTNVAPTITTVKPVAAIDENQLATLELEFTDPGTLDAHEVLVDWGDGSPTQTLAVPAGARSFTTTHQYLDDNAADQYTITVRVRDDDGGVSAPQTASVTVRNVAPSVTAFDPIVAIDENGEATLEFDFSDPGSLDAHQVIVNWGDGSPTQILAVPAGARSFTAKHKYLDDSATDQYTVTFHVRDDDLGISGPDTAVAVVTNVAPTITTVKPVAAIDENQFATLELEFTDPGTLDSHEVLVDWGDGTTQTLTVAAGARAFTTTHQYLDDNAADQYTITVRVRDDDGGVSAPQTTTATVRNVDPDVTVIDPVAAIDENGVATLEFDFSDPGSLDSHQVIVNWGDGSPTQILAVPAGARSFIATHQYLDDNAADQFTITFHVRDDDLGISGPDTAVAVVRNVAPTITNIDPVAMIDENQLATLELDFADPGTLDTHEVIIDWGDGSPTQTLTVAAGARTFTTTHQYLDDNAADQYTITVRVRDDDGGVSAPQTALVTVKNVNPSNITITPPPGTINEGARATYTFTFDDPGTLDTHTYVVDWGDGFTSTGTVVGRSFTATHTYADNDTFTIRATVTDDDGGVGIGTRQIAVANVPPTIVDIADDQTVAEGDELTLAEIARFTDPGFDNPLDPGTPSFESFTYTIDWGDTKSTPTTATPDTNGAVGTPSSGAFGGSHTYADNGTYTVTVTVTDDDGGTTSRTFTVVVTNVDPTLTGVDDPLEVDEGEAFTLNDLMVGLEDPGFNNAANQNHPTNGGEFEESFTGVDVDWGDGTGLHSLVINPASIVNGDADTLTTAGFEAGHTYADNGTYTVTLRFRDDDGPVVSRTFTIIVHNVAPTLNLTQDDFAIDEGGTLVINNLGSFSDPGFNNPANQNHPTNGGEVDETFTYIITWADGTPPLTYTVSAADVATGNPGVLTQGMLLDLLANTHKYVDNDLDGTYDNSYTITVTLLDDDGGSDTETFEVTVRNVSPTLLPISATDVNAQGKTTLTLSFSDPGADTFTIMVDWGDGVFVPEQGHPGPTPTTVVIEHFYAEPPDPNNPADDIKIRVQILDDDFGKGIIANGDSNVEDDVITNPGTGNRFIRIDTSPKVPMLAFPVRPVNATVIAAAQLVSTSDDNGEIEGSAGEAAVAGERYLLLELIRPDGTVGDTARLRAEVLNNLPALFRNLPDGHYRIFLVQADTQVRRLVIEVFVRDGRLIDPSDDSEGARDRPPGAEAAADAARAPAEANAPAATTNQAPADAGVPPVEPVPAANEGAAHVPGVVPALAVEAWPSSTALRHGSTLASVALALSSAGKAWRDQVDQSLAKAQSQQRKTLKTVGHWRGSRKPK
jgi:PKD repeat protein